MTDPLLAQITAQKQHFNQDPDPPFSTRQRHLAWLRAVLEDNEAEWIAAVQQDFGHRCATETKLLELFPIYESIGHAQRHLKRWMRGQRRSVSVWFWPSSAYLWPQPLGVIGIVSTWNYPLVTVFMPLIAALAAGNRVMIKPSEHAPRTGNLLKKKLEAIFKSALMHDQPPPVSVILGDRRVGQAFVALPFDHLIFTGSTAVGRQVMASASQNLVPVTLELGGCSPVVITPEILADPHQRRCAIRKLWIAKMMNAGQTCVAPNHVFIPEQYLDDFVACSRAILAEALCDTADPAYTSVIHSRHYEYLRNLLNDAIAQGATWIPLSTPAFLEMDGIYKISPGIVLNVRSEMKIMQVEIFGPLLPVLCYSADQWMGVLRQIQAGPRPLALYLLTQNKAIREAFMRQTHAGGVTVNQLLLHVAQEDLPFGGVGASGMGRYHGVFGFKTCSYEKPVYIQSRWDVFAWFYPPRGRLKQWILKVMLKGFRGLWGRREEKRR
jgi:acyl-CoA reductase-like NAD-dependent aldehyde dehydrogenase